MSNEDRELDAQVAETLMGWVWLERLSDELNPIPRKAIYPPLDSHWVRFNFAEVQWRSAQPETERFSDWDECCASEDRLQIGLPRYSTEISAAMEVVERMRELGTGISITVAPNGDEWRVSFFEEPHRANNGHEYAISMQVLLPPAICLAALASIAERVGE